MGTRIKTFDSSGVAPGGRLFASDLNAIQDQYADLVNYSQNFGASAVAVGDVGIQLLKYGTGEARITSKFRADGKITALDGLDVTGALSATVGGVLAGTLPNPTFAVDMATQAELNAVATGAAGGVLAGTYPNPSFAADMATQAELDTHKASGDHDARYAVISPPRCAVRKASVQSVPHDTDTALLFDTEDLDSSGMHSTVSNTDRITATTSGFYLVTGAASFASGGFFKELRIQSYTAADTLYDVFPGQRIYSGSTNVSGQLNVAYLISLPAGDFVRLIAYQGSGGAVNVTAKFAAVRVG